MITATPPTPEKIIANMFFVPRRLCRLVGKTVNSRLVDTEWLLGHVKLYIYQKTFSTIRISALADCNLNFRDMVAS